MSELRLGLLSSLGVTLDAFFKEIVEHWTTLNIVVLPAAGTTANLRLFRRLDGLSRAPDIRSFIRARSSIQHWVRDYRPEVVLTNTATASAIARMSQLNIPVVYFCHGLHWRRNRGMEGAHWKAIESILLRRTSGVVVLNDADEEWFTRRAPHLPLLRLRHGVGIDPSKFSRSPMPPDDVLRLCWIGEMSERKNPLMAIETAAKLRRMGIEFQLIMAGDGPLAAEVSRVVQSQGLAEQIDLPGTASAADVLNESHAIVHTARWEGLPRVLLEALAVGRHVFGFGVKGVTDIQGAVLADEFDAEGLAAAIAADRDVFRAPQHLPRPEELSFSRAAEQLAEFVTDLEDTRYRTKARV